MEMSNIPNAGFHPNDQVQTAGNAEQNAAVASSSTEIPQKRRPGRPKGSTKKNITGEAMVPKVKRPVGRPRKDGLPAGSMGTRPRLPKQPRTNSSASWAGPMTGVGYPQHHAPYSMMSAASMHVPIDPNLQDDWAVLARTNPNAFLTTLLSALAAPNPVSSAGPTVEEAFKSHLNSLTPMPNQLQPIPSLYSILKTFWLPSSPAYFSLTASASTARTPSEHRFLYWDPQPLVFNGISCPSCAAPLINRGRISSGPIKIYDIERPFFIIGCEYVCRSPACTGLAHPEGRKFASTDASIFRALPVKLKDEFPARLMYADADAGSGPNIWNWGALGVSRSLWNMVRGCLRAGMRKEVILQLVDAVQRGVPEDEPIEAQKVEPGGEGDGEGEGEGEAEGEGDAEGQGGVGDCAGQSGGAGSSSSSGMGPSAPAPGTGAELPNASLQTYLDAYNDAWKANSGIAPSSSASAPPSAGGSVSAAAAPQSDAGPSTGISPQLKSSPVSVPAPPTQVYDYTKGFAGYPYAAYAFFPPSGAMHMPAPADSANPNLKRPYPFPDDGSASVSAGGEGTKRSPRHCCKCGSQDCKGKGGRSFCSNGCQDCGKLDCKGRNSRRPDKKCSEGWL
ncbi:hypothetical protein LshimejAT787_1802110 [Lyophyllum shimeji]|uniref:Uncharacterized protein n=1 Tax=Lyophyllum shimeji TaxID=47721 RepID=A0A9P3URA7_LYOSH|nr:hypothetical protein LshimejAT787_1802110 [Lyophyllum shimeji]